MREALTVTFSNSCHPPPSKQLPPQLVAPPPHHSHVSASSFKDSVAFQSNEWQPIQVTHVSR